MIPEQVKQPNGILDTIEVILIEIIKDNDINLDESDSISLIVDSDIWIEDIMRNGSFDDNDALIVFFLSNGLWEHFIITIDYGYEQKELKCRVNYDPYGDTHIECRVEG